MIFSKILPQDFYRRPVLDVARELLGKRLVRIVDNQRVSGMIIETEAYDGEADLACHARAGRTPRTLIMYGPPGHAYVYFTYGAHWLLNCVTGDEDYPAAVLIRALVPLEGLELIASQRQGKPETEWTNGPAKICQAFQIGRSFNGTPLFDPHGDLFLEAYQNLPDSSVQAGPRVGINHVPEPWRSMPWRFRVVSRLD